MTAGADLSRLGSRNLGADDLELFLEKWSGEIFSKFKTACKFWNKNYTKHIDHGKAARFDALGEAGLLADDSRVAVVLAEKQYADHRPPGAVIDVTPAEAPHAAPVAGGDLMVKAGS